jgi:hypothetical protein
LNIVAIILFFGVLPVLFCQTSIVPRNDVEQISSLVAALSNGSRPPSDVLNPNLSPSDRRKNLKHFRAKHYELSLVPEGNSDIEGNSASVMVRVRFKNDDGDELNTSTTAHFVRRDGTWYFSDFDFMSWPGGLIVVLLVGAFAGVGYAATVLTLLRKLHERGSLASDGIKMFVPLFWPTLFRQIRVVSPTAKS